MAVTIDGMRELERALKHVSAAVVGQNLANAVDEGAELVRAAAARRAPRRTGNLAEHIITERDPGAQGAAAATNLGPSMEAFYGLFEELGTSDTSAHPFLRPGFDQEKGRVVNTIGRHLESKIIKAI